MWGSYEIYIIISYFFCHFLMKHKMLNLRSSGAGGNTIAAIGVATVAFIAFSINKKRSQSNSGRSSILGGNDDNKNDNDNSNCNRDELKSHLKSLLTKHNGCTKQKEVLEVVERLVALNPVPKDCSKNDFFTGEYYTLTAPPFPGKIENDDNISQFTLGRLSFNIFQPKNLICTVKSIHNPVAVSTAKDNDIAPGGGGSNFTYDIFVDVIIHTTPNDGQNKENHDDDTDGELEAIMINRGFCHPSNDVNNRMMVTFTGSSLRPKKNKNHDKNRAAMLETLWRSNFANAYQKADQERSYSGWMMRYGLGWFLGLTYPTDNSEEEDHTFQFEMKKPMSFHTDVLYLDEDIRITKGSRGTVVVAERTKDNYGSR